MAWLEDWARRIELVVDGSKMEGEI